MRNPKTIIGLVVLGVLLIALGILIGQMIPVIGQVRLEMSLTPTPEPDWPLSVMNVTPDPSMPTPVPVLRTGRTGQEVKDVQSRLYTLGYYSAEIDGQYGAATKEAVIAFQRRNGLDADGIVGAETRAVLFSAGAKPAAAEVPETVPTTDTP
jgi:peptidoglycan hydrolase-like protein with peptidoglycan-binding domain